MLCKPIRHFLTGVIAAAASVGHAAPSFQITSLYTNLDGTVQFVVLSETSGANGQHAFAGLTLSVTGNGFTKQFVFPHDLPSTNTAYSHVVVATTEAPLTVESVPHYRMPERFLPIDGGTLEFAGVDRMSYAVLPGNGTDGLWHDGTLASPASLPGTACPPGLQYLCGWQSLWMPIPESIVRAVEYYNPARGRYFLTAWSSEIDALDSGRIGAWQRTGTTFVVSANPQMAIHWNVWDIEVPPPYLMHPVCRLYLPPGSGNTRFFSVSPAECAEVRDRHPGSVLETSAAFHAAMPDVVSGACARGETFALGPVFRLRNGADASYRYTPDLEARALMLAQGYAPEGFGPDGVAFCVPLGL